MQLLSLLRRRRVENRFAFVCGSAQINRAFVKNYLNVQEIDALTIHCGPASTKVQGYAARSPPSQKAKLIQ